jgi:RNA-splicing ligase RtcB
MFEVTGKYNTAKIFSIRPDEKAFEQIRLLCDQEFVKDVQIRIMPDYHFGAGCTIGFTANLGDKVIPNLVGVDIGCFSGDTKIPLLNGKQKTLKQLCEEENPFWVYSLNSNGKLVAGKAISRKTRENSTVMKLTISGGEEIVCTPDHKFMLKDLTYKEAKDLTLKDSLMPLYRTYSTRDGYEHIFGSGRTHNIIAEQFFGKIEKGFIVHHKDYNIGNNEPENLIIMSSNEHGRLHANLKNTFREKDFQSKKNNTIEERGYFFNPKFDEQKKETAIKNIKDYMDNYPEKFKNDVKDNGERGKEYLINYNKSDKGIEMSRKGKTLSCDLCGRKVKTQKGLENHYKKEHNNHKVISIEFIDKKEDVYCLSVEEYHNFAISAGVFVHNCGMLCVSIGNTDIDLQKLDEIMHTKIPSGRNNNSMPVINTENLREADFRNIKCLPFLKNPGEFPKAIGSLGSGNHFYEVDIDNEGNKYLVVHSGSRNLGKQVADYYQNIAIENCKGLGDKKEEKNKLVEYLKEVKREKSIQVELDKLDKRFKEVESKYPKDLCFLEGSYREDYLHDMNICQKYASVNRSTMMNTVLENLFNKNLYDFESFDTIHNYVDFEDNTIRKGAVSAYEGEKLIIPINMRDGSLICLGKGNPEWNNSAPHGAGRLMGRNDAMRRLDIHEFVDSMDGIYTTTANARTLDEAPMAYKPMEEIIDAIQDTVEVVKIIKPIFNFKASE